jgi:hypothetical protein
MHLLGRSSGEMRRSLAREIDVRSCPCRTFSGLDLGLLDVVDRVVHEHVTGWVYGMELVSGGGQGHVPVGGNSEFTRHSSHS